MRIRDFPTFACLETGRDGSVVARTGDEIFSKVKAGIVIPLFVELKHSRIPPGGPDVNEPPSRTFRASFYDRIVPSMTRASRALDCGRSDGLVKSWRDV